MNTRPQQQQDVARSGQGRRAGYFFDYDCMKSTRHMADAGSIPATSTTLGVQGFDGMMSLNGQFAMVPAASGSAESGVRCDGPNPQTPMTTFIRLRRQLDDPAARIGTKGRHYFNGANAGKPEISTGRSTSFNAAARNCASVMAGLSGMGDLGLAESTPANTDAAAPYSDAGAFAGVSALRRVLMAGGK